MALPTVAMPSFETLPSSETSTPLAEIQVAARLLSDGHVVEALQRLKALSSAVPAYATSQVLLAKAYEAALRWEDALEAWHRAYFLAPGSPLVQRERRRLVEAQSENASLVSLPPIPSVPLDEWGDMEALEEVFGVEEDATSPVTESADEIAEPMPDVPDTLVAEPFTPDELVDAMPDKAEPFSPAELVDIFPDDDILEDDFLHVFVDEDEPVSDALGVSVVEDNWEDDDIDADTTSVKEPLVSAPEMDPGAGEPIHTESDSEGAWWKRSSDNPDDAVSDDVDSGWTVLSEMETEETRPSTVEGQIAPPIGSSFPDHQNEQGTHGHNSDANLADDLDALIRQLEDAPRIRPDPNFGNAEPEVDAQLFDEDADDLVSETLARIYVAQGQFGEAAKVYEKLADQHPEQAEEFSEKAAKMHARGSNGV